MRSPHRFSTMIGMPFVVVFFLSCSSRPDEALTIAQQAMEQAKEEQASEFAPGDWKSAEKAWNDAQTALKNQRYAEAAGLLVTSRIRFEKARTISKAKREEIRKEVTALQSAANKRLSGLRAEVDSLKISAKARRDLDEALRALDSVVDTLTTEVLNDQIVQARSSGQTAMQKLAEIERKVASISKKPMF
jgi:hypothetical protein